MNRAELATWLLSEWKDHGPNIALVEGFSGIGKSELARSVAKAWDGPKAFVTVSAEASDLDGVLFDVAAQLESNGARVMADQADGDFRAGLIKQLGAPCLIVIDNFNGLMDARSREVDGEFGRLAVKILNSYLLGRVLLVSDQSPEGSSWIDDIAVRTMGAPVGEEARLVLHKMLESRNLLEEVPRDEMLHVVNWLGGNPRAMQAFVACLRDDPLEDLVQLDSHAWDMTESEASPSLVKRLERAFLEKTIARLDPASSVSMEALSVFRKPFNFEGMKAVLPVGSVPESIREDLSARFLLSRSGKWY